MSKPIGPAGLKRISEDSKTVLAFAAATAATKIMALDPNKSYGLFAKGAGPSDVVLATTSDSKDAIANGTATYTANKTYTAMAAAGGLMGVVTGVTGAKITHTKSGAGTDDATTVAALGGRFQVRAVEGAKVDGGLGAYTALTAT